MWRVGGAAKLNLKQYFLFAHSSRTGRRSLWQDRKAAKAGGIQAEPLRPAKPQVGGFKPVQRAVLESRLCGSSEFSQSSCLCSDCFFSAQPSRLPSRSLRSGHLMGKKSTGESPYVYEGGSPKYQLRQHILWEEAARTLLGLMEGKGTGSHQSPPQGPLGILQSTPDSDSEDSSNFSDVGSRLKGSQCEGRNPQLNRQ
ncbi:PREDICTED: LOW QUALITY PROTEIN: gastrin-releasing peptide [Myotis brandtii]|uniref:LOW QUALITY PROTEIN: gastrin-releasing peptide n=1 Tax=Myotis brandtii TaxID=109478 RepID=UPI00070446B6|nr:PREDICTED: LOW QUALITY PROTEIN: gastrin-releasing peptide [Myotis brandtii]